MILDATAGNRVVWRNKTPKNVIFIDIQRKLEFKPTIFADNRRTPFNTKTFDTIMYDPPHNWNFHSIFWGFPDIKTFRENHPDDSRSYPTYYGMEIYKSRSQLLKAIFNACREFKRILKDDGLLWLNWSELKIELYRVLALLRDDWIELLRLHVASANQQLSDCRNYWICFQKKERVQQKLSYNSA